MTLRVLREVTVLVGSTVLAFFLFTLLLYAALARLEPAELLIAVPEFVFGYAGVALALWTVLVVLGASLLSRRGPWPRIGAHALSAFVAGIVNIPAVVAFGDAAGAEGGFVGALGLLGSVLFTALAWLATPIVVLILARRAELEAPASTSDPADVR